MYKKHGGFTLIEILVVVALIAILAAITIIAINPAKNFRDARDATRRSDITNILSAMSQYLADGGSFAADGDGDAIPDCSATTGATEIEVGEGAGVYDIDEGGRLVPTYLVAIPVDPSTGDATATGYTVCQQGASGRYQVAATGENTATMSVQR